MSLSYMRSWHSTLYLKFDYKLVGICQFGFENFEIFS